MSIPKIIYQTWKTTRIPLKFKAFQDTVREFHPDWQYRLVTDKDILEYMEVNHEYFLDIFHSYEFNIQRADIIRYFLLHDTGGVYIDLDVELHQPIDNMIAGLDAFSLSERFIEGEARRVLEGNYFMGSVPRHPYFKKVIDMLVENDQAYMKEKDHRDRVLMSTGPRALRAKVDSDEHGLTVITPPRYKSYAHHHGSHTWF